MAAVASSCSSSSAVPYERRGIPGASFVEDVQTYISQLGLDVNQALAFLQERKRTLARPTSCFALEEENIPYGKKSHGMGGTLSSPAHMSKSRIQDAF